LQPGTADSCQSQWSGLPTALLEASLNEIYVFDADTLRFRHANEGALKNLGYTLTEIRKLTPLDLEPEFTPESFRELIGPLLRGEKPKQVFETLHRRADGSEYPVEMHLQLLTRGPERLFLAVILDITRRREMERELRLLKSALQASANAVVLTDANGRIQWVNAAFCALTGYGAGEVLGQNPRMFKSGRHDRAFYENLWRTLTAGEVWHGEIINRRKDGTLYTEEMTLTPIRGAGGGITHCIAVKQDISDRKEAERRLKESEARLAQAQEMAHLGDWELDLDTHALRWSDEVYRIFGLAPRTVRLTNELFFSFVHLEEQQAIQQAVQIAVQTGRPYSIDHRIRRPDGSERVVHEHAQVVRDADGRVVKLRGTVQDITERKLAEEQVRNSEALYHSLVENVPQNIFRKDRAGRITFVNSRFCQTVGRRAEDILGKSDADLFPAELAAKYREDDRRVMDTGQAYHTTETHLQPTGQSLTVEVVKTPLRDSAGRITGVQGLFWDITERQLAEQALARSEEKFAKLFRDNPAAMSISRIADGRLLDVNDQYCALFGYAREELLGRTVHELGLWEDPAERERVVAELARTGKVKDCEVRLRSRDGFVRHVLLSWERLELSGNEDPLLMATLVDITERKQTEGKMAELFEILDQAREAIVVRDLEGTVLYLNQGTQQLSGYTLEEVIAKHATLLLYRHHREFEAATRHLLEVGEWQGEHFLTTKTGQDILVDGRWTLIRDDAGKPQSIVAISVDLTERKKLEAQFLRAQRMESIGALASGIAHDLNNILTPIVMTAPMLRMDLPADDREQLLATLEASAQRAVEVIKQILGFARGQEGERTLLQPRHLLREMGRIIRETFPPSIKLVENAPKDLWPVAGNATQLHQVLMNLCVNARDAMPRGGTLRLEAQNVALAEASVKRPAEAKPGNYVQLQVSDTGEGIPDAIRDKIFDPFFTTKETGKGTGLGLTTVLGIVKNHGGFLDLDSAPGRGTRVSILLPAVSGSPVKDEEGNGQEAARGRGELILVVDDEAAIRHTTQRTLHQHGYRTIEAAHGAEALARLDTVGTEVALVVTDLLMPVMDGVTLCQRLQQLRPELPRIVSTGTALDHTPGDIRSALTAAGVKHILAKPHGPSDLLKAIADAIQSAQTRGAPQTPVSL